MSRWMRLLAYFGLAPRPRSTPLRKRQGDAWPPSEALDTNLYRISPTVVLRDQPLAFEGAYFKVFSRVKPGVTYTVANWHFGWVD